MSSSTRKKKIVPLQPSPNTFQVAFQDGTQTTYTLSNSINGSCGTDVTWTFEDGVLTISGTGAMTDDSDASPAPWNDYKDSIQKVVITSGITQIGANAFAGCSQLRLLVIPTSVTQIQTAAFSNCPQLQAILAAEETMLDFQNIQVAEQNGSVSMLLAMQNIAFGIKQKITIAAKFQQ